MPAITGITVTLRGSVGPLVTELTNGSTILAIAPDRTFSIGVLVPVGGSTLVAITAKESTGQITTRTILVDGAPAPTSVPTAIG
ncbi:hypothetical protein LBMAG53_12590 [Planctomycetota bacterium]|nr:hypothetical protein LBMAG53_12590 [Planctomycetota bacterium]